METPELRQLEYREAEYADEVAKRLRRDRDRGIEISERDLYPELDLEPPYSYCIGTIRPSEILPFFNTLIVDLRPIPTPQAFEARYGLTVNQFTELVEQGRIAVRLRDRYTSFESLGYLDGLLDRQPSPPLSTRYVRLYRDEHGIYFEEGQRICPKRRPAGNRWRREYVDWVKPPTFREAFAGKFALVSCYFGSDYAREIVDRALSAASDPAVAYDWLHIFSRLRVYPFMNCLDGLNTLPMTETSLLPQDLRRAPDLDVDQAPGIVPYEVGRALLVNLPLTAPWKLEEALRVPSEQWIKVIGELDNALESGEADAVNEKCVSLERLARETRKEVERMRRRKGKIESAIVTVSGIGIVGALSEYAPPEWKPIVGVASGTLFTLRKLIANTIVKFRKKSHVAAWFDLEKEFAEPQ